MLLSANEDTQVKAGDPILVIRWIASKNERDEIAEIREELSFHYPISAVRAHIKDEVYGAFEPWLKTSYARILYIGAHGTRAASWIEGKTPSNS